ncbi:MAG: hypothetical protein KBT11_10380 [Treponema sp.]|nr:hypothetical protein [Candidatus Treponema equifaecale]
MKKRLIPLFSILFAALVAMTGCSSMATEDKGDITIKLPAASTRAVNEINFTVSLCDITEKTLVEKNGKSGDTIVFEAINIGTYVVKVECFDDLGNSIGKGSSECIVQAGITTNVSIKIKAPVPEPKPEPEPIPEPEPQPEPDPIPEPEPEPEPEDSECTILIAITFKPFEEPLATVVDFGSVTAEEGLMQYKWYLDGNPDLDVTGNVYTKENLVGKHVVTLIAKNKDGKIYSVSNDVYFPYKEEHVGKLLLANRTIVSDYDSSMGLPFMGLIYAVENPGTEENCAKVLAIKQSMTPLHWLMKNPEETIPDLAPLVSTGEETAEGSGVYQNITGSLADDAGKVHEIISEEDPEILSNRYKYEGISWAHEYGRDYLYGTAYKNGWYLPGINELEIIINFYNGTTEEIKRVFTISNGQVGSLFENRPNDNRYLSSSIAGTRDQNGNLFYYAFEIGKGPVLSTTDTTILSPEIGRAVAIRRFSVKE